MISKRQEELLKLIVEDYIQTARPVSSKSLCKIMKCSSATIRNEMSELEKNNLLEKTHTSSGRVPSEQGYRYYVDHIMQPRELTGEDVLKLQTVFQNKSLIVDDTIIKSLEIISEITNYTTVVLGNASVDNKVSKVEIVPLDEQKIIAIVVTDQGHVEHRNIFFQETVPVEDIRQTVDLINKFIIGVPICDVSRTLEYDVKPIIGQYIKQHELLYNAFYSAFSNIVQNANVKVAGTHNILSCPEFHTADKMTEILSKFDDKELVQSIEEENNVVHIYIGSENEFYDDTSVIKTKYQKNGIEGTIALIGPKRMEYDRVVSLLNYIKEQIEKN